MPSSIVHLKVAFDLREKLNVKNSGQFYVGAVSPDAVNIDGFADQSVRYPAHLRSLDYEEWKQTTRDFLVQNRSRYKDCKDFLKGFLLHIFTDIYWDELAQPKLFEGFEARGAKPEELKDLKWNELYKFNHYLEGEWLYDEVLPQMSKAEVYSVGTVSKELLARYIDSLTTSRLNKTVIDEPPEICSLDMVKDVENACIEELDKLLDKLYNTKPDA